MENSGLTLEFLLSWVKALGNQIIWDRDNWAQPNPNERAAADLKKFWWAFESNSLDSKVTRFGPLWKVPNSQQNTARWDCDRRSIGPKPIGFPLHWYRIWQHICVYAHLVVGLNYCGRMGWWALAGFKCYIAKWWALPWLPLAWRHWTDKERRNEMRAKYVGMKKKPILLSLSLEINH